MRPDGLSTGPKLASFAHTLKTALFIHNSASRGLLLSTRYANAKDVRALRPPIPSESPWRKAFTDWQARRVRAFCWTALSSQQKQALPAAPSSPVHRGSKAATLLPPLSQQSLTETHTQQGRLNAGREGLNSQQHKRRNAAAAAAVCVVHVKETHTCMQCKVMLPPATTTTESHYHKM